MVTACAIVLKGDRQSINKIWGVLEGDKSSEGKS